MLAILCGMQSRALLAVQGRGPAEAIETTVARAPLWTPRHGGPVQLVLPLYPIPFLGGQLQIVRGDPLPIPGMMLFAHLCTVFLTDGAPAHRRVPLSGSEASRLLGHRMGRHGLPGGRNYRLVLDLLTRMRALTVNSLLPVPGDARARRRKRWGLIESFEFLERGSRHTPGHVVLSEPLGALLRAGSFTVFDGPTFRRILERDPLAARWWILLETDSLPPPGRPGWPYLLWAAPPDGPQPERANPTLTDLLYLGAKTRRNVVARLSSAARVIGEESPELAIELAPARGRGMWKALAWRDPQRIERGRPISDFGVRRVGPGDATTSDRDVRDIGPRRARARSESTRPVGSPIVLPSEGEEVNDERPLSGLLPPGAWETLPFRDKLRLGALIARHSSAADPRGGLRYIAERIIAAPPGSDPLALLLAEADATSAP